MRPSVVVDPRRLLGRRQRLLPKALGGAALEPSPAFPRSRPRPSVSADRSRILRRLRSAVLHSRRHAGRLPQRGPRRSRRAERCKDLAHVGRSPSAPGRGTFRLWIAAAAPFEACRKLRAAKRPAPRAKPVGLGSGWRASRAGATVSPVCSSARMRLRRLGRPQRILCIGKRTSSSTAPAAQRGSFHAGPRADQAEAPVNAGRN